MSLTKELSPEEIAEMSEDCQCSCKELDQLRADNERLKGILRAAGVTGAPGPTGKWLPDEPLADASALIPNPGIVQYVGCGEGPTAQQREHCLNSALYPIGDCVLVWVNEGDILMHGKRLSEKSGDGQ